MNKLILFAFTVLLSSSCAKVFYSEDAVPLADRRADSVDDHGGAHGSKLEHVLVLHKGSESPTGMAG